LFFFLCENDKKRPVKFLTYEMFIPLNAKPIQLGQVYFIEVVFIQPEFNYYRNKRQGRLN